MDPQDQSSLRICCANMSIREIELAIPLIDEVVSWIRSGAIFNVSAQLNHEHLYMFEGGEIPFRVVGSSFWYCDIDINNEDSRYVDLMDLTDEVEGAYRLIHQFGQWAFQDYITAQFETIRQEVIQNPSVVSLAKQLYTKHQISATEWDERLEQIHTTILGHFAGIFYARAVSLSSRHAPMEALFYAYQQGLMPFGWDWESIICLDPNNLEGL